VNPCQEKIYRHILDKISTGEYPLGYRIPTELELSTMFQTKRLNAHYAIKPLEEAGLLARNKKKGTVVKAAPSLFLAGRLREATATRICVLNQQHPDDSGIHWNENLLSSLDGKLKEKGFELSYRNVHHVSNMAEYRKILEEIVAGGCKTLLLISGGGRGGVFEHPEILSEFHDNIFIFDPGQSVSQMLPYNTVSINLFKEGVEAAERLLGFHDLKRIVIVCKEGVKPQWFEQRSNGIAIAAKRQLGDAALVETYPLQSDVVPKKILYKFAGTEGLGIIAATDQIAAKIIDAANGCGVKIGGDGVKMVSFDDDARFHSYALTTLAPSLELIGRRLAKMILDNLDGKTEKETLSVKVDSTLMVRETA